MADNTLLLHIDPLLVPCILPSEKGSQTDRNGNEPNGENHGANAATIAGMDVVNAGHGHVPARDNEKEKKKRDSDIQYRVSHLHFQCVIWTSKISFYNHFFHLTYLNKNMNFHA